MRHRLLGVEVLGLVAVLRLGEVEVAGDAQQLVGRHRGPGAAPAVGDVGLDRAEIAAAVEDDGERVAERQAAHPQRDGGGRVGVDQRSPEQLVGWVLVQGVTSFPGYRLRCTPCLPLLRRNERVQSVRT